MQDAIIETECLYIRHFRERDLDDFAALCADPLTMRYVGDGTTLPHAVTVHQPFLKKPPANLSVTAGLSVPRKIPPRGMSLQKSECGLTICTRGKMARKPHSMSLTARRVTKRKSDRLFKRNVHQRG